MILLTNRLSLRAMRASDASALFAILGDPAAMAFWDRPALPRLATVEAQLADELAAAADGGFAYWTVLKDGQAIGSIDLADIDAGSAWTGFAFRRDMWGQGFAREALAAVIGHAFEELRLTRLTARIQTGNSRAMRLLEGLGFQKEAALPDVQRDGQSRPCVRYGLNKPTGR